jgi:undecaprenyl-diphosphatase
VISVLVTAAVAGLCGVATAVVVARRRVELDAPRLGDDTIDHELETHPGLARLLRRLNPSAATLTGAGLVVASVAGAVVASFVGIVWLMISTDNGLARSDTPLAEWARDNATEGAVDVLHLVTSLGGTPVVLVVAVAVAALGARKGPASGVLTFVTVTVLGQFAITNLVKWIIDRSRPDLAQLAGTSGASFPSGHATAAAATWACVALVVGRGRSRPVRAALAGGAAAIATAVAASRVFLGVHWLTDVVAGVGLGWGWFAVCSIAFGGRALHFGQPVERAEDLADDHPEDPVEPPTGAH